ncbi:MAG: isochorismatase family protein [Sulfitobacter sp.]|nr:isochorismatase family protein [Sulfitobacter sp.]
MINGAENRRALIEGNAALLVIDIQKSSFYEEDDGSIASMPDYSERMARTRVVIDKARDAGIPVIFIQEVHRANLVDFGRELDGDEDIHLLDSDPGTDVDVDILGFRNDDYLIPKRRYSAFYGTDLEILLRGLKVQTLILTGGLTNVCVHYTFVDGHQGDYFCRVIEDCVAGSDEPAHQASLTAMEYLQHGAIRSLDEVMAALDGLR